MDIPEDTLPQDTVPEGTLPATDPQSSGETGTRERGRNIVPLAGRILPYSRRNYPTFPTRGQIDDATLVDDATGDDPGPTAA